MMCRLLIVITLQLSLLGGCAWVKLTAGGTTVTPATESDVVDCQKTGMVSAHTKDKVVVSRSDAKVREGLLVLARNEAAKRGGDTIVAMGPPQDGEQGFTVYRCQAR